jgi:hypothetical protein|tara:strand:+ start:224 stop:535 length:312 start_codon:yes stop_codon:yes gene_type:complete
MRLKLGPAVAFSSVVSVLALSLNTLTFAGPSTIWGCMVRLTRGSQAGNINFHGIPAYENTGYKVQSVAQLGIVLSGGCVRQAESEAIWIWDWANVRTKVVVLP